MTTEEIWSEYRAAIKAFLHARVANPADVDDLLQEILIKTHRSLTTLNERESLKAWLFRTARNATTDFYRRQGRGRNLHPDDLWYGDDDVDSQHQLERCVIPFIAGLPEDAARLLTAVDIEGQSQKDYAQRRGIRYSTLKSRVRNARRDLRKLFDDCCHLSLDSRGAVIEYRPKSGRCENC